MEVISLKIAATRREVLNWGIRNYFFVSTKNLRDFFFSLYFFLEWIRCYYTAWKKIWLYVIFIAIQSWKSKNNYENFCNLETNFQICLRYIIKFVVKFVQKLWNIPKMDYGNLIKFSLTLENCLKCTCTELLNHYVKIRRFRWEMLPKWCKMLPFLRKRLEKLWKLRRTSTKCQKNCIEYRQ